MDYQAFHKISYGIYIVATESEGKKAGYIANTVFQVTASPPQLAISCSKNNQTLEYLLKSRIFTVSSLKKDTNASLIGNFGFSSGAVIDKFAHVHYNYQTTGAPVVTDSAVAWFDCRVVDTLDLGSHMLLVGEVLDCGILSDDEPLTYQFYREKFKMLSPRNAPTYIEKGKLQSKGASMPEKTVSIQESADIQKDFEPYICQICGHVYRPEEGEPSRGIPPGTPFSSLPEDFRCPVCNAGKDDFKPLM